MCVCVCLMVQLFLVHCANTFECLCVLLRGVSVFELISENVQPNVPNKLRSYILKTQLSCVWPHD